MPSSQSLKPRFPPQSSTDHKSFCKVCLDLATSEDQFPVGTHRLGHGQAILEKHVDGLGHTAFLYIEAREVQESGRLGCLLCEFIGRALDRFGRQDAKICIIFQPRKKCRLWLESSGKSLSIYRQTASISTLTSPELAEIPARAHISESPHSERAFGFLRDCLQTCLETHHGCVQRISTPPRRLIDLGLCDPSIIALVEPSLTFRDPYVALSYCWGNAVFFKTIRSNIQNLKRGFGLSDINGTIADAVQITRELGLRYLWVDSLCIVQDDSSDWEEQSRQMGSIYEHAYLVIAASSSDRADESFLDRCTRHKPFTSKIRGIELSAYPACRSGHHGHSPDPLSTRGWALQESILTTRAISFSRDELQWRCKTCQTCECEAPVAGRESPMIHALCGQPDKIFESWGQIIRLYTARHLTIPEDMLPALSGIAQLVHGYTSSRYLAGIWEEDLPNGLCWHKPYGAPLLRGRHASQTEPTYRAPSFSWASVDGEVTQSFKIPSHPQFTVLNVTSEPSTSDPFGRVRAGSLRARGVWIQHLPMVREEHAGKVKYAISTADGSTSKVRIGRVISPDDALERYSYVDVRGDTKRSVKRATCRCETHRNVGMTTQEQKDEYSEATAVDREGRSYTALGAVSLLLLRDDGGFQDFLVLGVSPNHHDSYERLGFWRRYIGDGESRWPSEFGEEGVRTITIF